MLEKIENIIIAIVITLFVVFAIFVIREIKEMLNDHRCYNLPLNEFYNDKKCERYWNLKEWSK